LLGSIGHFFDFDKRTFGSRFFLKFKNQRTSGASFFENFRILEPPVQVLLIFSKEPLDLGS
jgi:hypothetical protein